MSGKEKDSHLLDEVEELGLALGDLYSFVSLKAPEFFDDEDFFDIFKSALTHYAAVKNVSSGKSMPKESEEEYEMESVFSDYGLDDVLDSSESRIAELIIAEQEDVLTSLEELSDMEDEDALPEVREIYASYDFDMLGLSFLGVVIEDYLTGSTDLDEVLEVVSSILDDSDDEDDEEDEEEFDDEDDDDTRFIEVEDDEE